MRRWVGPTCCSWPWSVGPTHVFPHQTCSKSPGDGKAKRSKAFFPTPRLSPLQAVGEVSLSLSLSLSLYIYIYIYSHTCVLLVVLLLLSQGLGASPSQSCDLSGDFSAIRNGFMIGTLLWEGPIREGEEEHGSPSSNDVSLQLGEQKSM